MAAAIRVQAERERRYPSGTDESHALYITSGAVVRRLSLAYAPLAADLYWIRSLQYYGGTKRRLASEPAVRCLHRPSSPIRRSSIRCCIRSSISPRRSIRGSTWRIGSGRSSWRSRFQTVPVVPIWPSRSSKRGYATGPTSGSTCRTSASCTTGSARTTVRRRRGSTRPAACPARPGGSSRWRRRRCAQGGDRRSSRQMWTAIRESAEVDWLQQDAERRLLQLRALDEIDGLEVRVSDFLKQIGQRTPTWQALVGGRVVPGVMADPSGTPYELTRRERSRCRGALRCGRYRWSPKRLVRPHDRCPCRRWSCGAWGRGRQLSERLYLQIATRASVVWPASACARCGRALAWFENVPVVSYLVLRGRCRTCGEPISRRAIRSSRRSPQRCLRWAGGTTAPVCCWRHGSCWAARSSCSSRSIASIRSCRTRSRCRASSSASRSASSLSRGGSLARGYPAWRWHFARPRVRILLPPARGRPGHGRFQDARDDRRVSRMAADARDADDGVAQRLDRRECF